MSYLLSGLQKEIDRLLSRTVIHDLLRILKMTISILILIFILIQNIRKLKCSGFLQMYTHIMYLG